MRTTVVSRLIGCAVALALSAAPLHAAPPPPAGVPPEVAGPALDYANALATGDLARSWNLLSPESQQKITAIQWEAAFSTPAPARKAIAGALLRALASSEQPPLVADVLPGAQEALIEVKGVVQIAHQLVLVKTPDGWRIDLSATDRLNSADAGRLFLDTVRDSAVRDSDQPRQSSAPSGLALARLLLASKPKAYHLVAGEMQRDRAQVTVEAQVPVNLVLRAKRAGPGWLVDIKDPLLDVDFTSADPLLDAGAAADESTCQQHLQQLAGALRMYLASSDDRFPDPDRWLDQIQPYLSHSAHDHCPADPGEGVSYAMNRNLAGKRRSEVGNPSSTPLLFESTLHSANPSDAGNSWADPPRHPRGNLVLFADGSVRFSPKKPSFGVTQAQPQTTGRPAPPTSRKPAREIRLP